MSLNKRPYRGTRDFFPAEQRIRNYIFSKMHKASASFGYECYDGPLLEEVELYKAKSGEELINEQIYSFTDRGERFVAIRPEMTPTLARMVSQIHREYTRPIRWYSIPNLMRYEKPQKGRLREHWQLNCDIFGTDNYQGELEILQLAIFLLQSFGANHSHFEILINDRTIVDSIFSDILKLDDDTSYKLYKIIDRSKKVSEDALSKMIRELNLCENKVDVIHKYLSLNSFEGVIHFLNEYDIEAVSSHFSLFVEQVKEYNLGDYLVYDPAIVRGLDYYTGIVFEIFDKNPNNRRALCGGGAYANLLGIFNEGPVHGVGFGLGDVTFKSFLENHKLLPNLDLPQNDILLAYQDERAKSILNQMAMDLRRSGINVISTFDTLKFKKIFSLAQKRGANFVGFMNGDEFEQKQIQIKNLSTKNQKTFSLEDVDQIIDFISK